MLRVREIEILTKSLNLKFEYFQNKAIRNKMKIFIKIELLNTSGA